MIFIAEIGSNHLGDLERAKGMIQVAADCGAQIAKFQLFKPEQYPHNIATPEEWIEPLREETSKAGIGLLFSVFYPSGYYFGLVKIAYSQRHNFDLIKYWRLQKQAELIISGDKNTHWLYSCIRLACVPKYPAKETDYNPCLRPVEHYRFGFGDYDGISDHTIGTNLIERYKPKWVEKHFKLGDEGDRSPDAGAFAIAPVELKELCQRLQ